MLIGSNYSNDCMYPVITVYDSIEDSRSRDPEFGSHPLACRSIDDALFQRMYNPYHVIHQLLPARRQLVNNIRQRHHDRQLTIVSGQLRNRNFIHRTLFEDCY